MKKLSWSAVALVLALLAPAAAPAQVGSGNDNGIAVFGATGMPPLGSPGAGSYGSPSAALWSTGVGFFEPNGLSSFGINTSNCTYTDNPGCVGPTTIDPNGIFVIGALAPMIAPSGGGGHTIGHAMEIDCIGQTESNGTNCKPPLIENEYISLGASDNHANENNFWAFRSRGTGPSSPAILEALDDIIDITGNGDDGTGFTPARQDMDIYGIVSANSNCHAPTTGFIPTEWVIQTSGPTVPTPPSVTSEATALILDCDQSVEVPNGLFTANKGLVVVGTDGSQIFAAVNASTGLTSQARSLDFTYAGQFIQQVQNNTNPGVSENIGEYLWQARNSSGTMENFGDILALTNGTPTTGSEYGRLQLRAGVGSGTLTAGLEVVGNSAGASVVIPSSGTRHGEGTGTINATGPWYDSDVEFLDTQQNAFFASIQDTGLAASSPIVCTNGSNKLATTGCPSQTANYVLAAPNGSSGAMSPRPLVGADIAGGTVGAPVLGNAAAILLGHANGINCNATGDTAITITPPNNASSYNVYNSTYSYLTSGSSSASAVMGLYTGTGASGTTIMSPGSISLTTASPVGNFTGFAGASLANTVTTIYLHISTAEGATCVMNVYIVGRALP